MNKLHNFSFVGEFPMFDFPDSFRGQKKNLQMLSQEIYLPPVDNSKAYYDLADNYIDIPGYNMSYLEGQEMIEECSSENRNAFDELDVDFNNIHAAEFIFLDSFDTDIQNALPDISLQDIFLDPNIMKVKEKKPEKMLKSSDFVFGDSEVINLYYLNENPLKERKVKYSSRNKENKHSKRRRNLC